MSSKSLADEFPIIVERASAKHDHGDDLNDPDRKYSIYNHKMDYTIEEGIKAGLPFQTIKKKLFKTFPSAAEEFKGTKGLRRLYQKVHR